MRCGKGFGVEGELKVRSKEMRWKSDDIVS